MVKMVPHRIVRSSPAIDKVVEVLKGEFSLDDPKNWIDIACEKVCVIPRATNSIPVMNYLVEQGLFDYEDEINSLYLPIDKHQALILERSPYGDPPIESYVEGCSQFLSQFTSTETFAKAKQGDKDALQKVVSEVRRFQQHMIFDLNTAKLLITFPYNNEDRDRDLEEIRRRKIQ